MLELVGRKHRAKLGAGATLNEAAAAPTSNFARRQLEKLGWKDGEGLGKKRDGMATHIRAVKRQDSVGLGAENVTTTSSSPSHGNASAKDAAVLAGDWWKHSLGDTLARLQQTKNKKKKKKDKKEKHKKDKKEGGCEENGEEDNGKKPTKRHFTDDELFQATGGARFGMRQGMRQAGKWQRAESNISMEDEEQARLKTEWDGMTTPQVVLSEASTSKHKDKKKRKRDEETHIIDSSTSLATSPPGARQDDTEDGEEPTKKRKKVSATQSESRRTTEETSINKDRKKKKKLKKDVEKKQKQY